MKKILCVLMSILMVVALVGCAAEQAPAAAPEAPAAAPEAPAAAPEAPAAEEAITIALVPKCAVSFFDDCRDGGAAASEELGINFEWVVPEDTQGSTQVAVLEQLIAKGVNGIAVSCNEPQSVEAVIAEAKAAGISVICFDSDSPDSQRNIYIGTNNYNTGYDMGKFMAEQIGGAGQVAIITGQLGASNLNERIDGIEAALADYPDIEIVDIQGTDDDIAKAVDVAENYFRTYPDLKGIFGVSQSGGPGSAKVLATQEFADKVGKVTVIAFDDLEDVINGIKEGYITATMVQRPVTMGKLAAETLYDMIKNGANPTEDIDTGCTIVTIDNIDSYTK